MIIGGWRALRQYDIKLLLAYGTVSQLGFLIGHVRPRHPGGGAGRRRACSSRTPCSSRRCSWSSASSTTSTGTRDLRKLSGVGRAAAGASPGRPCWPPRRWPAVPPLLGFTAKEAAFEALIYLVAGGDGTGVPPLPAVSAAGPCWSRLGADRRVHPALPLGRVRQQARAYSPTEVAPSRSAFAAAPVILGAACLVGGFVGPALTRCSTPLRRPRGRWANEPRHRPVARLHRPAAMSAVAARRRRRCCSGSARSSPGPSPPSRRPSRPRALQAGDAGLDRFAVEVTAVTQRGSLPIYLGSIMLVLVVLPGVGAAAAAALAERRCAWDTPGQLLVGVDDGRRRGPRGDARAVGSRRSSWSGSPATARP